MDKYEHLDLLEKEVDKIISEEHSREANEWAALEDIRISIDRARNAFKYNENI